MTSTNSLGRRVTLVVFGAIGCTLALCAVGLGWFEYRAAETRLRSALEMLAQATLSQVVPAVRYDLREVAERGLARLSECTAVNEAAIYWTRPDGGVEPFARYSRPGARARFAAEPREPGYWVGRASVLLVVQHLQPGEPEVRVQIEASLAEARRGVLELLRLLGVALVLLLLVGAVLSRILQRSITRPILALAEAAARVHRTGDYNLRVGVASEDEVGLLARSMNEMLTGIAARDRHLAESSAFRQAILENAGVSIITAALDGTIRTFNAAAQRMLACAKEEVVGRVTLDMIHSPEEMRQAALELGRHLGREVRADFDLFVQLAGDAPHAAECTYVRRDGARLPVFEVVSMLRTVEGEKLGLCAIATDLTERKAAEEAIRRLNAELERRVDERTAQLEERVAEVEKLNAQLVVSQQAADRSAARLQEANASLLVANQELEAFSYSVSHDLRAPLRNVNGFVELLRRKLQSHEDAEVGRFLDIVRSENTRMGTLIDDLLTFSRVGRTQVKLEPVDLGELVLRAREALAAETEGRSIEWVVGELPVVRADRSLLLQVLINLLANAAKFTRFSNPARIEVGAHPSSPNGEFVTIFVRDNGVGFNPQYVDKLFRVFQRLHNTRDFEGTGIGLANVKRIITRHGGRVWAEGAVDKGATFHFTLRAMSR